MPLPAGSRLGTYEILGPLGAGGMGEVYRARDPKLGRDVAIKVLPEDVARDPDRLARFEREARSLAALNHPGIVTIFAVEESDGARFLAMELVEGDGLDTLVPPGGLPLPRFLEIAVPLAEALSAAHERGIVHRDLKPGNVMVTREGRVKVLDFGLARVEAADSNADLTSTPTESRVTNLTSEGQVFGTVAYMSPEQARGARVDARSDVFSLGIVMYQMLTGDRPFHGATAVDLISSILRDRPASVTDLRPDLPPDLAKVVRRCLEKEPRDRYQTSRDVYNELRELRAESASAPPPAVRPRTEAVPPERHDSGSARTQAFWIAVLPFTHAGADPELTPFAEGLAEDIHAGLAKFPYLSVISRNSTLRFKTQTPDVRTVGQQLGARYVLEGGIRRAGAVLRVHVQLVDTATGAHLWAETYNRDLKGTDVLAVQDDVTDRIVATVADTSGALVRSMAASVEEKPDCELTASDVVLRHWRYQHRGTPAEHARVRDGLEKFVESDPGHADVWACLARLYIHEFALGFNRRPDPLGRALRAAQRAVDLDPTCQHARAGIAQVHFFRREVPAFRAAAEQAIALNPRDTDTLGVMGNMLTDSGDFERGPKLVRRAMELNPHFPDWFRCALAAEHFQKADYAAALDELARMNMPGFFWVPLWTAACCGLLGRQAEGSAAVQELRRLEPGIASHAREFVESWLYASGFEERFLEGLRKAGLEIFAGNEPPAQAGERPVSSPPVSGSVGADEAFWVAVLPFRHTGTRAEIAAMAEGLTEDVVTGLSRFSYLKVIARSSSARYAGEAMDVRSAGRELGARYVMEGSVRQMGGKLRIAVQLVETATGAHLWAESFERSFSPESLFDLQDDLVPRIVSTVADMAGVLPRSMSESLRSRPPEALTPYEAVLRSFGYFERYSPQELASARIGLEAAVRKAPAYADAWAMLSYLCAQDYVHGYELQPGALEAAASAARRAVELGPSNHLSWFSLAQSLSYQKDFDSFRHAAERAVELNPMDGSSLALLGELLLYAGSADRGMQLADRAKRLNPVHAGGYYYADFYDAFSRGDDRAALDFALKSKLHGNPLAPMFIAAAAGQLGDADQGSAAVRDLLKFRPELPALMPRQVAKIWNPEYGQRFLDGLRKAGLEIPEPGSVAARTTDSSPASRSLADGDPSLPPGEEGFWIAVLPLQHRGETSELANLAEGMTDEIVTGLARFSYLRVISRSATRRFTGESTDVRAVGREVHARYVLDGSVRQAGTRLRIAVQLVDTRTGAQLWSETYDQDFRPEAVFEIQDALAPRIVSTVADMHGVLPRSMSDALRHRSPDSLSPHEAVLRSFGYFERVMPEDLAASRTALEAAVRKEPAHADAWAMLGLMGVQDYAQGFGLQGDALERGFEAARRAVDLAPTSPLAHFALAQALFFRRELEKFRHEAERTVSLNPLDGSSLALVAEMLAHSGEWERALALERRARQLNPHHPGWYWYVEFWDAYRRRDYRSAREFALKSGATNHWGAHLNMAAACAQLGDRETAAQAVREAVRLRPNVAETFREDARKWFDPKFAEHLIEGLRKAGLDVPATTGETPTGPPRAFTAPPAAADRRPWIAVAVVGFLVVGAAVVWMARSRTGAPAPPQSAAAPQAIRSLAVLPLDNYSGDPSQDYFAEGMTDELTSDLANISGLRVISRGSAMQFKGKDRPPTPAIAKKLDVDAVVEGSVIRSGDKVRITAQLIDARSDRHLWAKSFERSSKDVLALQDELASAIAREIHVTLTPAEESRLAKAPSVNPEAYDAYLKGRYFFNRPTDENLSKAIEKFEEATRLDPNFAPAYSGLSDAYAWAGFNEGVLTASDSRPKAKAAAEKAIALDDDSAEGHTSLANYKLWYEYDWAGSEAEFRRAIALNPNYAYAHDQFGVGLAFQGRFDEAIAEGQRAAALDPLSPQIPIDAASALQFKGDYAAAREMARRGAELAPSYFFAPFAEGSLEIQAGRLPEAIAALRKAKAMGAPTFVSAYLAYAYGASGDRARALAELEDLKKKSLRGVVSPYNMALVSLGLGDRAAALDHLEKAYATDSEWLGYLKLDKTFDSLRSEPRFQALLKKLNFPA